MVGLVLAVLLLGLNNQALAGDAGKAFGFAEKAYSDLTPFSSWTGILDRYREGAGGEACASGERRCAAREWADILHRARDERPSVELARLNRLLNQLPYRSDEANWNQVDYWQSPEQFLLRGGDCEDYAIAKYLALRELGWDPSKMKIVVLFDTMLDIHHAVLLVRHRGETLVLDNQIGRVAREGDLSHYRPIYAINENSWWRYMPPEYDGTQADETLVAAASGR